MHSLTHTTHLHTDSPKPMHAALRTLCATFTHTSACSRITQCVPEGTGLCLYTDVCTRPGPEMGSDTPAQVTRAARRTGVQASPRVPQPGACPSSCTHSVVQMPLQTLACSGRPGGQAETSLHTPPQVHQPSFIAQPLGDY